MRKRFAFGAVSVLLAGVGWMVTAPVSLDPDAVEILDGDVDRGALVFAAAGCGSCHGVEGSDALAGGKALVSDFGTFYAPNISQDAEHGIGGWSYYELQNAIQAGVSPQGTHYYPAFPYAAYSRMAQQDVADLIAYLRSLPADATPSQDHDIGFPFNIRRAVGFWKALFSSTNWVIEGELDPLHERGRYLVEALGHCAECHTPRNALGGLKTGEWMRGAPNPSGEGRIPSIHPDDLGWSAQDIAIYLETGFTPDFDTVGGSMVDVVDNMAKLTDEDRAAIAQYLVALD